MTTIATFGDALEASLARNYLESAGIRSFLADELTMSVAWHLNVAIGGVKLQVDEQDASAAAQMLAERHTPIADTADDTDSDPASDDPAAPLQYESGGEPSDELAMTAREHAAERAWRGAIFGLFFPPIELYILWLLIQVFTSNECLRPSSRRRALIAAAINIPVTILTLFWLRSFLPH